MPTISSTSVPSNATPTTTTTTTHTHTHTHTNSSKDRDKESVRRRLFPAKTFTDNGTQTGPDATTDAAEAEADLKCSICFEQTGKKNVTTTECGHIFCTSCLLKNLTLRNTCPNCRAEIEPARSPAIEPLNATIVANIIRDEENTIDLTRRIAVIGAFPDAEGRAAMILSLSRELAFGSAHSMAGWQGTSDETYHSSWSAYEYNGIDDDEDDDDEDEESEDDGGEEVENNGHTDSHTDSSGDDESIDLDPRPSHIPSSPFVGQVQELRYEPTTPIFRTPLNGRSQMHATTHNAASQRRSPFQSPQFQPDPTQTAVQLIECQPPIEQYAVSVEPVELIQLNHYFDLIVEKFIRLTLFAFILFVCLK